MQKIPKVRFVLTHTAGMSPFAKIVPSCLFCNRTHNVFAEFSRKKAGFAPRSLVYELADASGLVGKKEEVAAEVSERLAVFDEALRYVTDLY